MVPLGRRYAYPLCSATYLGVARFSRRASLGYDGDVKPHPEPIEGPEAAALFDALVRKVLSIPHEEIMRREAEYKRQSLLNPHRRGPKPKVKT